VSRWYGNVVAVNDVTMTIGPGVTGLLGPNGAGKSTLLALLAGGLEPSSGSIERRAGVRIGWTPQRPAHYGRLSPRENLELFADLEGEAEPAAAATHLLGQFELPDAPRPSARLSVGNRQRLNLAISLLGNPDVLLLDEPTASLDPPQRRKLWQTAVQHTQRGGAVVFATQNHEELEGHADRVLVLLEGVLVFDGPLAEYERTELARTLV
jgi:ABC-2 type transport system ATP-binding protein